MDYHDYGLGLRSYSKKFKMDDFLTIGNYRIFRERKIFRLYLSTIGFAHTYAQFTII